MIRNGLVKWLVTATTVAGMVGGEGSYLCKTEQGTIQVEHAWNGGCLAGMRLLTSSADPMKVDAAHSPCGACTDIGLRLDSSLPSDDRMVVRSVLTVHGTACICDQSMRSAAIKHVLEPAFHPPQDSTPSAVRTVVLIV